MRMPSRAREQAVGLHSRGHGILPGKFSTKCTRERARSTAFELCNGAGRRLSGSGPSICFRVRRCAPCYHRNKQ